MCLILDTNKYGDFLKGEKDMKPVRKWLGTGKGKLVHSYTEKMKGELDQCVKMKELFVIYFQKGIVAIIDKQQVEEKMKKLHNLKSDDPDIVALALVSGAKLLVSGDQALHADFKEQCGGSIYTTQKHQKLLRKNICKVPEAALGSP